MESIANERVTENPALIRQVLGVAQGECFLLWGRTYRRQSTYQKGDTVLYICEADRLHLGGGGRILRGGRMITRHYRGLRYACIAPTERCTMEYHADGSCNGLFQYAAFRNTFAPQTVCTPVGVWLS